MMPIDCFQVVSGLVFDRQTVVDAQIDQMLRSNRLGHFEGTLDQELPQRLSDHLSSSGTFAEGVGYRFRVGFCDEQPAQETLHA